MRKCIYCVSDSGYFEKFKILFYSLRKHNYLGDIRILLINPKEEDLTWVRKYDIKYTIDEKSFESVTNKKGYCANIRASFIKQTVHEYDVVAYFDVDSIVRKDIESFFDFYNDHINLYILQRNSGENLQKMFAVGVIGISVNSISLKFIDLWIEKINSEGIYNWFSDQVGFAKAYLELKDELKLRKLEMSYIDWAFHPFSKIWVGKGERKNEVRVYKAQEAVLLEHPMSFRYIYSKIILLKYMIKFFLKRLKIKVRRKILN